MEEDTLKPISGLLIMGASEANRTRITDAGPPADYVVLIAWAAASVVLYIVFGVVRPFVMHELDTTLPQRQARVFTATGALADAAAVKKERRYRSWLVRQLFSCSWSWFLVETNCRLLGYLFLAPTMLWRRRMLPLPQWALFGRGEWINKARFLFLCGPTRETASVGSPLAYFLLGGFFRDVLELTSPEAEHIPGLTEWAAKCQRELQWKLPVSGVLHRYPSAAREAEYEKRRQYSTDGQRELEVQAYHEIVVVAVLMSCTVTIGVFHLGVTRLRSLLNVAGRGGSGSGEGEDAAGHAEDVDLASEEIDEIEALLTDPDPNDADDSWPTSPEAQAEESRLRALRRADEGLRGTEASAPPSAFAASGMTLTIQECWPTLLGCIYAGMYAYVGGSPLLMRYLYPALIVVSSALAVLFSA